MAGVAKVFFESFAVGMAANLVMNEQFNLHVISENDHQLMNLRLACAAIGYGIYERDLRIIGFATGVAIMSGVRLADAIYNESQTPSL